MPGPSAHARRVAHQQLSPTEFATRVAEGQAYEAFRVGYETGKVQLRIATAPGLPDRTATFDVGERCLRPELRFGGPGPGADAQHDRLVQFLRGHAAAGKCLTWMKTTPPSRRSFSSLNASRHSVAMPVFDLGFHSPRVMLQAYMESKTIAKVSSPPCRLAHCRAFHMPRSSPVLLELTLHW